MPVKPTQKLQLQAPPPVTPSPSKHKSVTPQTFKASAVKSTPPPRKAARLEHTPPKPELSALNQKAQALRARVGPTPTQTSPQTPKTDLDSETNDQETSKEEENREPETPEQASATVGPEQQTSAPVDSEQPEKPKRHRTAAASKIAPPIHVNEEATWL